MKVLMLGWELPPHNSGGLGVACYQLCKTLAARNDVDIEFDHPLKLGLMWWSLFNLKKTQWFPVLRGR